MKRRPRLEYLRCDRCGCSYLWRGLPGYQGRRCNSRCGDCSAAPDAPPCRGRLRPDPSQTLELPERLEV